MSEQSRIIPNTFQTPNLLTDDGLMALLSGNEVKCYLVVIRKTFGWRKDRDRIAKSQIAEAAGISEPTVDDCMATLVRFGLVLCTADNNAANEGKEWAPQVDDRLIDYAGLTARQADAKQASVKRTEKARRARGGVVQQPHLVQQPGGGVVQQPPQQPIKTNSVVVVNASGIEKIYEREIGALTPLVADAIKAALETYPADWIPEAIAIAVTRNARRWDYVEGILRNCKSVGKRPSLNRKEHHHANGKTRTGNKAVAQPAGSAQADYSDADRAAAERVKQRRAANAAV